MSIDISIEEFEELLSERDIVTTINKISPQVQQYSGQHIHSANGVRNCLEELSMMIKGKEITSRTFGELKDENSNAHNLTMFYFHKAFTKGTYTI